MSKTTQTTKTTDDLLTAIAREQLGIETLATQGRDRLDFHDVSVEGLRRALLAAYNAGRQAADAPVVVREAQPATGGVAIPAPPAGFRRGRR